MGCSGWGCFVYTGWPSACQSEGLLNTFPTLDQGIEVLAQGSGRRVGRKETVNTAEDWQKMCSSLCRVSVSLSSLSLAEAIQQAECCHPRLTLSPDANEVVFYLTFSYRPPNP